MRQHQAACRIGAIEPPAGQIVKQRFVIELRIVPPERELEPVLALCRAVAGARCTAHLVQHRLDVAYKADLRRLAQVADVYHELRLLPARGDGYLGIALADGMQQAVGTLLHHGFGGRKLRGARQVDALAIRGGPGDEHVRALIRGTERHFRRSNGKRRNILRRRLSACHQRRSHQGNPNPTTIPHVPLPRCLFSL